MLAKTILAIFLSYEALVLPYKTYMAVRGHGVNMASVSYIFESVWKDDEWHARHGASFFTAGGGNSMCAVAREKCVEFEKRRLRGETVPWENTEELPSKLR